MRSQHAFTLLLLLVALPATGRPVDFPTGGNGNANKILGTSIPTLSPGGVLTVGAGPTLSWTPPAPGVSLSNVTPNPVSTSTGSSGVGNSASREDHVHALPVVPKSKGGFGVDVSTGQTNGYFGKIVGGALTLAAILAGDLPTGIDVAKLAAGTVSNTVFGYLANVTSDIQAQLNLLLPATSNKLPPTPSGAGKLIYDNGSAYVASAAGTTSQVWVGGSTPGYGSVPPAAITALTGGPITGTYTLGGTPSFSSSITFVKESSYALQVANTTTSNANGGGLFLQGAAATGTGQGGGIFEFSGAGGATSGIGGAYTATAGQGGGTGRGGHGTLAAGAGGATSGEGGDVRMLAGHATAGTSNGGQGFWTGGNAKVNGTGGHLWATAGNADVNGSGGNIFIQAGASGSVFGTSSGGVSLIGGPAAIGSANSGGPVGAVGGTGNGIGSGGLLRFNGGPGGASGINGPIQIGTINASVITLGKAGGSISLGDGTVTQATSVSTSVTIDASSGVITTFSQSAAAGTTSTFTVTNSCVVAASVVSVTVGNYAGTYGTNGIPVATISAVSAGSFAITIVNVHATNALSGALKLNFTVL